MKARWRALDNLRGLAILLMLPVNAAMDFQAIPPWLKHAPGAGLTMADFILPAFLFSLGLSASLSLASRLKSQGLAKLVLHALLRNGLLFAFGSIGYFLVWRQDSWEVLQLLGLVGLVSLPFLFLPVPVRLASAGAILALVEALRPAFLGPAFSAWYGSGIGGPWGALPLAALPIAASALGEAWARKDAKLRSRNFALAGLGLLGLGLGLWAMAAILGKPFLPADKHLLSPAWLLVTTGAASLALAGLEGLGAIGSGGRTVRGIDALLGALGRNPLFCYMGGGILTLGVRAWITPDASAALAWGASLGVLAVLSVPALALDRRGRWLRL